MTLHEWAAVLGVKVGVLRSRLNRCKDETHALTQPFRKTNVVT